MNTCHLAATGLQPLPMVSPEGTQEGMNTCHLAAIGLQPLPMVSPEKTQDVKIQDTGPDSWGIYQRNDFSEPRLLYLPIQRKALNLGYLVFFNNNLLMFRLPTLCCKTSVTWLLPSLPWSSSLRVTWDAVSWTWSPKNSHWIKHNSQFLDCEYSFKPTGPLGS